MILCNYENNVKNVIFTWGRMGWDFKMVLMIGQRDDPLQKKQKQTQQNICVLGASQLIQLINVNHNKYNKYLSFYKNYNEEYSIINDLFKE
jgi:hypothetical protein